MSQSYVPPPPPPSGFAAPPAPAPLRPVVGQRTSQKKTVWIIVGVVLGIVLLVILFVTALLAVVFGSIKSSEPYRHAVDAAVHDPRVVSALGAPVQPGWLPSGSISVNGTSGDADLSVHLQGSAHGGTVFVTAHRSEGAWSYKTIAVRVEGSDERIDLLPPEK